MNKYYCPYCNPKYQFPKEYQGKLVCGLCGEDLIKKPIVNIKQFIALLLVFSFSLPFILIIFSSLNNLNKRQKRNFQFSDKSYIPNKEFINRDISNYLSKNLILQ